MTRITSTSDLPASSIGMILCLLLIQAGISTAGATLSQKPASPTAHDTGHPLVLAGDADFLLPLLALHREALSASKIAAEQAVQPRIRNYAARAMKYHRGQIATLKGMVQKLSDDEKPDFHIAPVTGEMRMTTDSTVSERYLHVMIRLMSEKIELAELASGTVKSNRVKRMAARTMQTSYDELMTLSQWLRQMSP